MNKKTTKNFNLEKAFEELEQIVQKMDTGEIPLEESLKLFERGVYLLKSAQQFLKKAELKVQQLSEASSDADLIEYTEGA